MKNRIPWLDIAKCFGIFFIYLGHFTTAAGSFYPFVMRFHVPLFFFLSGCSEWLGKQERFDRFLLKNTKSLMIPLFLFSFASMGVNFLQCCLIGRPFEWYSSLHHIFNGNIRVHFYAAGLWFLSCLFVMKLVFYFLRKCLRVRVLILAACLGLFIFSNTVLPVSPVASPAWPYNVDSMLYYIIYYALGYCLMEPLQWLLDGKKPGKRAAVLASALVLTVYAVLLFLDINLLAFLYIPGKLSMIYDLIAPTVLTLWVISISHLLRKVSVLAKIGQSTLYLCGTEYIIKRVVSIALSLLGWPEPIGTPLYTLLYTTALLLACQVIFVPIERFLFRKMKLI